MSEYLASYYATMELLDRFGIRAKKKYGQNFLINRSIVDQIVDASQITKEDCVLEIGPGIGTMTQILSDAARQVVAVEIDGGLQPVLAETVGDRSNVTVLWQDILKTNIRRIAEEYNNGHPLKTIANLPYYITTPILMQLLQNKGCFESITIMVQKEVADRICAGAGSKEYGALSLAVQYYSKPEIVCDVSPSNFIPRPGVDSVVLCLRAYEKPPVETDEKFMFALIRACFNQRRKTLANAVSHGFSCDGGTISREEVTDALQTLQLPEDVRGEKLTLQQFADLANQLRG